MSSFSGVKSRGWDLPQPEVPKETYVVLLQFKSDGTGGWTFTCQHGPEECEGNLYQVCLLDKLAVNSVQVEAVHCMMADDHPDQATKKVKNLF